MDKMNFKIITTDENLKEFDINSNSTEILHLSPIYNYESSENVTIRVPSYLKAIEKIYELNPDEIFISTPGPVGILGIICAKLLNTPCHSIYNDDYLSPIKELVDEESLMNIINYYIKRFYCFTDKIFTPTEECYNMLKEGGYDCQKIKLC